MNWKRYNLILVLFLVIIFLPSTSFAAQAKIQGDYCYQYGDSESLMVAKEISYAMALRKAIETYKTFVASTSVVQDFKLRKDLVETIASGYVENVQIIKQDVKGRNVCTELVGYVNSDAVKSVVARKVERERKIKKTPFKGLASNHRLKILNYERTGERLLRILYQAKKSIGDSYYYYPAMPDKYAKVIVHCFDSNGSPIPGTSAIVPSGRTVLSPGEVKSVVITLPAGTASFELAVD